MENRNEIRLNIKTSARRGDWVDVANRVGLSADMVRRVVRGTRNNDKVLAAFQRLLDDRRAATQELQSSSADQ
ncbi:hypothetical protein [Hymenobacter rubripertinctus]|uniref:XRE family transcriptional regulator n=1 Tax=Hymenobacter rubripertinctus TaxID=2029981 RepID=A0A418QMY1_9BACT|nr:hypothetical protein [Hymenobacter rubripertinctus]RIY06491.1 hypothetical protein D0T11_18800 [Hymenobacter rubripertinctus]